MLYLGVAHVSLALAFAAIAVDPRGVSGFFYHPRMLGIVHLITLGWITSSLLGIVTMLGALVLRVRLPATWVDYAAFALVVIGFSGMVSHFWLEEYSGMAWSASTVGAGIVVAGVNLVRGFLRGGAPHVVTMHVALAFVNVAGAAAAGVLLGFDKLEPFLPGVAMSNVFAHAHLAAIGWASMMVVGVAFALAPRVLGAPLASGWRVATGAALLQAGVWGLFGTLLFRSRLMLVFAVLIVAGFGAFLWHIGGMVDAGLPRRGRVWSPAFVHAVAACAWLAIASALGVWLTVAMPSASTLRGVMAYGVFGLVGFLSQMVIAIEVILLPLVASSWSLASQGNEEPASTRGEMRGSVGTSLVCALWLVGVPALAWGLAFDAVPLVSGAAWSLLAATLLRVAIAARILHHASGVPATVRL